MHQLQFNYFLCAAPWITLYTIPGQSAALDRWGCLTA